MDLQLNTRSFETTYIVPCISVGRTKASPECGQTLRKIPPQSSPFYYSGRSTDLESRRSTHVPNLTNEFSTAREWRSESIWYGRFSLVRPFVELNLGSTSTHGAPYESHFAPVSLQSQSYSVRSGR